MKKILFVITLLAAFASCKKADLADDTITGEGLVPFSLSAPNSGAVVLLNSATPAATVSFSWTASVPGLKTAPVYRLVMALRNGNVDTPLVSFPAANGGLATNVALTHQQLDDALKAKGIAAGIATELKWSVVADNNSTKLTAQATNNITITRFGDGATAFVLLGPASGTTPVVLNPNSNTDSIKFNWTRSRPGNSANPVRYRIWFYKDDANTTPVFSALSRNGGADSVAAFAWKQLSDSLSLRGYPDINETARLKWKVAAVSGNWTQWSDYTNTLYVVREVKMYLVGAATPGGWDISKSVRMIPDPRNAGAFYIYVYLLGGNEFKFVNGQAFPPAAGAIDWGQKKSAAAGIATDADEDNIVVPATSGVYRVTFDSKNLKYYVQAPNPGGVGLVGQFQGWNETNPTKMFYTGVNQFILLANMNNGDGFKFHDGNEWNNSAVDKPRYYGTGAVAGKLYDDGGSDNVVNTEPAGRVRVIFDGSDIANLKYSLTPGDLYVIGEATVGGWDNLASQNDAQRPPFTYLGNGKWTITTTLKAGQFKFIVKKGSWDFNYGIKDGKLSINGDNLSVPANGTYTITIDEYNQTYTVL